MAMALGKLYATIERAVAIPGELAPEVSDVITAAERGREAFARPGIRLTPPNEPPLRSAPAPSRSHPST